MGKFRDWLREKEQEVQDKGIYVGVKFTQSAEDDIKLFCDKYKIPNSIPNDEIHSTLVYSRTYDNIIINDAGEDIGYAEPLEFDVFDSDDKRCLVLKLNCEYLVNRHNELMSNYKLTYDFDEYIPHITLSYDIGDFDISQLDIKDLPSGFTINTEYKEDLNINKENK